MKIKQRQTLWICLMHCDWEYNARPIFIAQDNYPLPLEACYADKYRKWYIQAVIDYTKGRGLFKSRRKALSYCKIMNREW